MGYFPAKSAVSQPTCKVKDTNGRRIWAKSGSDEWLPGHCQVNEKSLPDALPLRKAEGVGIAKIQGLVQAQNPL
jgi:hypothetical protein